MIFLSGVATGVAIVLALLALIIWNEGRRERKYKSEMQERHYYPYYD